jgi:hypothetical protein
LKAPYLQYFSALPRQCVKYTKLLLKGIVALNKLMFWRFQCTAGNFLFIRWKILNFKIVVFYFKNLKSLSFAASVFTGPFPQKVPVRLPIQTENITLKVQILV